MTNTIKNIFVIILSILFAIYLLFLILVPSLVDANSFKPQVKSQFKKDFGLNLNIENIKFKTTWNLRGRVELKDIDLKFSDKEQLFQADKAAVEVAVMPLIFKIAVIEKAELQSPIVNIIKRKNGKYKINELLSNMPESKPSEIETHFDSFHLNIKDYKVKFIDFSSDDKKESIIAGEKFIIKNFNPDKGIQLDTMGFIKGEGSNIKYDLKLKTELPTQVKKQPKKTKPLPIKFTNPLEPILKHRLKGDLVADLKIKDLKRELPRVYGDLNINDFTVKTLSGQLPKSKAQIHFKGDKLDIKSKFYVAKNEYINISGKVNPRDKKLTDLKVKSTDVNLNNLKNLALVFTDIANIDTKNLENLIVKGHSKADFVICTNLKKFNFDGYFNLKDAYIGYKGFAGAIHDVNGNLKLIENSLIFDNMYGFVDTSKFTVKGNIDKNANANIELSAPKVNLKTIYEITKASTLMPELSAQIEQIKTVNGFIDVFLNIKGKLDKIEPNIKISFDNASITPALLGFPLKITQGEISANIKELKLKNIKLNALNTDAFILGKITNIDTKPNPEITISIPKFNVANIKAIQQSSMLDKNLKKQLNDIQKITGFISLKANISGEKTNGIASLNEITAIYKPLNLPLRIESGKVLLDEKNIELNKILFRLKNSPIRINGAISNYIENPTLDIKAKGLIISADIKSLLPQASNYAHSRGTMPFIAYLSGIPENLSLKTQLLSNSKNYISIAEIEQLRNKTKILNLSLALKPTELKMEDISLRTAEENRKLSSSLRSNLVNSIEVLSAKGILKDLNTKNPEMQNLAISLSEPLSITVEKFDNAEVTLSGKVNVNGKVSNPTVQGNLQIENLSIPTYNFKADLMKILMNQENISIEANALKLDGSDLTLKATMKTSFSEPFVFKNLDITSENLDVDKIISLNSQPQQPAKPLSALPLVVDNGKFKITTLKVNNILAYNSSGHFKINEKSEIITPDLKTKTLGGFVKGNALYNIPKAFLFADIKASDIDAAQFMEKVAMMPGQLSGKLNSEVKISTSGLTPEQMTRNAKGKIVFDVKDGQAGSLGNMEYYLKAANLASNNLLRLNLDNIISTLHPKNTGKFEEMQGVIYLNNGIASLNPIKSKGENLSLYITGDLNLTNNVGNIIILGRTSQEIVQALGVLGDLSLEKLVGKIPGVGLFAKDFLILFQAQTNKEMVDRIPPLIPEDKLSKEFQVRISGDINKPTAVKSFKWLYY